MNGMEEMAIGWTYVAVLCETKVTFCTAGSDIEKDCFVALIDAGYVMQMVLSSYSLRLGMMLDMRGVILDIPRCTHCFNCVVR